MAQEIVTWCDLCMERDDSRIPGATYSLSLNNQPPRDVDLCDGDRKVLLDPLTELLDRLGGSVQSVTQKTATRKGRPSGPQAEKTMPCLICDDVSFASQTGMRGHYLGEHELRRIASLFGTTCPVCNEVHSSYLALNNHVVSAHPEERNLPTALRKRIDHYDLDTFKVALAVMGRMQDGR